jgi:urease
MQSTARSTMGEKPQHQHQPHHQPHPSVSQQPPQRRFLHLSPRELDHLRLHQAGRLAQYRLARGLRLNHPEAVSLIAMQMMEEIRDGKHSVAQLMSLGQSLLGRRQVMAGVASLIGQVQVEATFPDGTKLLTIHTPIAARDGDLAAALSGSFLPVPDLAVFGDASLEEEDEDPAGKPGQVTTHGAPITINEGRALVEVAVTNTGDRPIQVGSHYAFVETNKALAFDRQLSIGKRLNLPSGASVRFEPGESKQVTLVELGGTQRVVSGNLLTNGCAKDAARVPEIMQRVTERGFLHTPQVNPAPGVAYTMERAA